MLICPSPPNWPATDDLFYIRPLDVWLSVFKQRYGLFQFFPFVKTQCHSSLRRMQYPFSIRHEVLPDVNCQLRGFDDDVDIFPQVISPVHGFSVFHSGNSWKPSVCTAGTGGNTSWLELLRPSLEFHDVRPDIRKSIGCPHKVHWIHQLNTPTLGFAGKSLERRLWHQWDVGSICLGRRSRWSADERPTWYRVSVAGCTPGCHVGSTRLKLSPSLLLF